MKKKELKTQDVDARSITFTVMDEQNRPVEMIRMNSEGFFYKGKKVEDIKKVYQRFSQWLEIQGKAAELELAQQQKLMENLQSLIDKYPDQGVDKEVDGPAIG